MPRVRARRWWAIMWDGPTAGQVVEIDDLHREVTVRHTDGDDVYRLVAVRNGVAVYICGSG